MKPQSTLSKRHAATSAGLLATAATTAFLIGGAANAAGGQKNGASSAQPRASATDAKATRPPQAAERQRPNIIFILCDDLGYGDLSCFGQKRFTTPNLDRMASEGTRLTHHYAASPVCVPTRASLMLGVHTGHSPVRDHQFDRAIPNTNTMASVLRQAGYRTMVVGKWGIGGKPANGFPAHPQKRGFDAFYGLYTHQAGHVHYPDTEHPLYDGYRNATAEVKDAYSTDLYTAKAKQWITEQVKARPQQPFFLYLAYIAPHSAFDVPDAPYPAGGGLSGGVRWPLKTNPAGKNRWLYPEVVKATYDHDDNPKTPPVSWTDQMKRYATMVRRLDQASADLLQTLRDLKIDRNTLVVLTSDNGPAYDRQLHATQLQSWGPLDGFKRDLCEGGMREPTIVWWPGTVAAGATSARASVQYDWLPTFAQLAGQVPPAASDGVSLVSALTRQNEQTPKRPQSDYLYWEFHGPSGRTEDRQVLARKGYTGIPAGKNAVGAGGDPWGQQQAIRIGDLVGLRARITEANAPLRLYNVVTDPHEDNDISGQPQYRPILDRMQQLMLTARRPQPGNPRPYDTAPLPAVTIDSKNLQAGLQQRTFLGAWPWAPDVRYLKAAADVVVSTPAPDAALAGKAGAVEYAGYLSVPETGRYVLTLEGGKQAHLWLHEAHLLDSEADAAAPRRSDSVLLAAGLHPIRILVTAGAGIPQTGTAQPAPFRLSWKRLSGANGAAETIPPESLLYAIRREEKVAVAGRR